MDKIKTSLYGDQVVICMMYICINFNLAMVPITYVIIVINKISS